MSERFDQKVALVTGAGSGIGSATVHKLIQQGANVVAADNNERRLGDLQSAIKQQYGDGRLVTSVCDVSQRLQCEASVEQAVLAFGKLDVLVNSAGISRRHVRAEADFEEAWDRVMEVNLKGSMLMSHAAAEVMKRNDPPSGAIVNLGSVMSFKVYNERDELSDGFNAYPHSKGAILQLTRDIAVHMAPFRIRANAVCPGFVDTALTEGFKNNPNLYQTLARRHPLGRFGTADEIANVILFMASDDASFVTGACWAVDGGYLAV